MPGLMPAEGQMPEQTPEQMPAEGQMPEQMPAEGQPDMEGNVSPEEQAEYDQFVDNGLKLIYNEAMTDKILERLQASDNPVEGLANVTFMVIEKLITSGKQNGKEFSGDIKFHGGVEILEDIANLAMEAGLHEFSEEELESAMYATLDLYGEKEKREGTLDEGAAQQDMAGLIQMDQDGTLEQEFPGLKEKFSGAKDKMNG